MKAKFRSGKIITGRLAETFTRIGITKEVKRGRKPDSEKVQSDEGFIDKVPNDDSIKKTKKQTKKKKNEKVN
jgi:hypothetical protein